MNIYEKIEQLYQNNSSSNEQNGNTSLNKQILIELRQIKELLSNNYAKTKSIDTSMRDFIAEFRSRLSPNADTNTYPEVKYRGRALGVNYKNLLYDKNTSRILSKNEAFEVYRYFYDQHLIEKNR